MWVGGKAWDGAHAAGSAAARKHCDGKVEGRARGSLCSHFFYHYPMPSHPLSDHAALPQLLSHSSQTLARPVPALSPRTLLERPACVSWHAGGDACTLTLSPFSPLPLHLPTHHTTPPTLSGRLPPDTLVVMARASDPKWCSTSLSALTNSVRTCGRKCHV